MSEPMVSVIIATYNRANTICAAVDSVLEQTYPNIKLIGVSIEKGAVMHESIKAGKIVEQNEIAEFLFGQGVSSNSIELLDREFDELKRIAKWYSINETPSESETIVYLVVPILRALA